MFKKTLVATAVAIGFAAAGSAQAANPSEPFTFNPNGTGFGAGAVSGAVLFDEAPGNVLAQGGATSITGALPVGTAISDLYQANLGSVQGPGTNNVLYSNGTGGTFFTIVASFTETVTSSGILGTDVVNNFSINPGGTFEICAQTAGGNNLTGAGFACATPPRTARAPGGTPTSLGHGSEPIDLLDQAGADNWSGTQTVSTDGSAKLTLLVTAANPGYFPDLILGSGFTISFTNSSLLTPYHQVDPSRCFTNTTGTVDCATPSNIGAVNGVTGPDFIFQADANTSFARVLPEPATLGLFGLALAGLGFVRRRT